MSELVSLKRTKDDEKADKDALGGPSDMGSDGSSLHLEHHHLTKLGVDSDLPAGSEVEFHAKGRVDRSSSSDDGSGVRRSAHIVVTHMSKLGEGGEEKDSKGGLREEIERNAEKMEED